MMVDEVRRRARVDGHHCRGSGSVTAAAPHYRCGGAEGAVTAASHPGGRSPGGAADAAGRYEQTMVDDIRHVESDATAWLLGLWLIGRRAARSSVRRGEEQQSREDEEGFRNPKAVDGRTRAI